MAVVERLAPGIAEAMRPGAWPLRPTPYSQGRGRHPRADAHHQPAWQPAACEECLEVILPCPAPCHRDTEWAGGSVRAARSIGTGVWWWSDSLRPSSLVQRNLAAVS